MWKTLVLAGLMASGSVMAAKAETAQECLDKTFEIARVAQDKKPDADAVSQMQKQLGKVEDLCDAENFTEAETERAALKALVDAM